MNVETFYGKFEVLAEAPDAVARMRQVILELAVSARLVRTGGEWPKCPLKELTTKIGSGATPHGGRENYAASGVPLIRSMNVHFGGFEPKGLVYLSEAQARDLSNAVVQPDDVLLNITGASIGRVTTAPLEMSGARVNQHVTVIRPTKELLPRFLSLFLGSPSVQWMINDIEVGATRQALTKGMIERFEIPLPPLAEQKRIVAKVDELMALCDRLEAQQAEREARHAPLARAALARFAQTPTPANLEYLFHPAYDVAPAELRQSILALAMQGGLVQRGGDWPKYPLKELATKIGSGATPDGGRVSYVPEGVPLIRSMNVHFGGFEPEGLVFLNEEQAASLSNATVQAEDVLLNITGASIGRVTTAPQAMAGARVNQHVTIIRPKKELDPQFLSLFLASPAVQWMINDIEVGATRQALTKGMIERFEIPLPPLAEQRRIIAKVNQLMALVDQLEAQLAAAHDTGEQLMKAIVAELTAAG